jgi:hypothetical protein
VMKVIFKVCMAANKNSVVFWHVTPCSLIESYVSY